MSDKDKQRILELEAELAAVCKVRDEWCAEYVRVRNLLNAPKGKRP